MRMKLVCVESLCNIVAFYHLTFKKKCNIKKVVVKKLLNMPIVSFISKKSQSEVSGSMLHTPGHFLHNEVNEEKLLRKETLSQTGKETLL